MLQAFLKHMKGQHQPVLDMIRKDGQITESTDGQLKEIVQTFLKTFTA